MDDELLCTKGCDYGNHGLHCFPAADPENKQLRLLRAIYGLCPDCDETARHTHHPEDGKTAYYYGE